ncbi:MAG: hypothetical protein M3Q03_20805, partial [Chloroflexota bacterium]|nr:hypothetical protein [Chloroflexota bacterium]
RRCRTLAGVDRAHDRNGAGDRHACPELEVMAMVEYIGRSGYVDGYRLLVSDHCIQVTKDGVPVVDHLVPPLDGASIGDFVAGAERLRAGWGRLPTGDEVVAVFDDADRHLGYVVDLTDETLSGWGEPPTEWMSTVALDGL